MKELSLVLIESLRKQAFSVILLICVCAGLWTLRKEDRTEFAEEIRFLNQQVAECDRARQELRTEVAALRERFYSFDKSKKGF